MIYGKLYNISWFVIQKGLQFVWFYGLRICILTSILRITIYTFNYKSVWINTKIAHLARRTILLLHINQSSFLLESYVHFNQLEVELGSYIPKANVSTPWIYCREVSSRKVTPRKRISSSYGVFKLNMTL